MKKLLARLVRQSPAMIVAMLALFVALTGTAVATTSALITGKQIKNNSITGADIKNKSVGVADLATKARGARGSRGVAGPPGAAGAQGAKGDKGDKGDTGPTDLSKFGRAGSASGDFLLNPGADNAYVTELSTTVSSGASPGFVVVHGNMGAYTTSLADCPCQIEFRVRNATTGVAGGSSFAQTGNVADADGWAMDNGAVSGVFPIGANQTHTFDFQAVVDDNGGTPSITGRINLTAVYVPYNATGTTALASVAGAAAGTANP